MVEKYNLNWETFSEHLQLMFKELYEGEKHSDVTLVCDDQTQFKAHKFVLSACSPVFKKIIDNNPSQEPLIYLRGIQSYEMESILQFMYLGEGRFFYERMVEFIKVAKDLEVTEISNSMGLQMMTNKNNATEQISLDDEERETDEDVESKQKPENPMQSEERHLWNQTASDGFSFECPEGEFNYERIREFIKDAKDLEVNESNGVEIPNEKVDAKDFEGKGTIALDEKEKETYEVFRTNSIVMTRYRSMDEGFSHHEDSEDSIIEESKRAEIKNKEESVNEETIIVDEEETNDGEPNKTSKDEIMQIQPGNIECPKCGMKYLNKSSMVTHYRSKHEGVKYPCNQCDSIFKLRSTLHKHIQSQHEGRKYPCKQCDFQTASRYHLQKHIEFKHEGIRYPCNQCDYQSATPTHLKTHIKSKHEGIKHHCDQCDYQTAVKGTLNRHIQSQHRGYKYPCDLCDYQATAKNHLRTHIQSKHEGIKYYCDQCDYQATQKSILQKHIKSKHEGIRYPCDQCEYQANQKSILKTHVQLRHEGIRRFRI